MKAVSCVSPAIRYFSRDRLDVDLDVAAERLRGDLLRVAAPRSAARMAFQASSGNLASMTSDGAPFGILTRQSGRLPLDSVAWNS